MVSVPVQSNFNFNIGASNRTQYVMNIQPVIPRRISDDWNLITRIVTPIIWGVGPTTLLPTATNTLLGQGKWGLGPSVVLLTQPGHWTLGILLSDTWSIAGNSNRAGVNQMLFQYFIN
jgi:hypothetical protein